MKRKRSRRPARHKPAALDLADQALAACRRIETLATLLKSHSVGSLHDKGTDAEAVVHASFMIASEAKSLRKLFLHGVTGAKPTRRLPA